MAKNKNDLTILTVVENDPGLFELMLRSVEKFTNPLPTVLVCDNTGGKNIDRIHKANVTSLKVQVFEHNPSMTGGSNRHGEGLGVLLPHVITEKAAIIESDCMLLRPGWDKIDISKYKLRAARKETKVQRLDLYHMCFVLFSARLMQFPSAIDFRPGNDKTRSANKSYEAHEDVGWRMKERVDPRQIDFMEFRDCKNGGGFYFDDRFQSDEIWHNGHPVVAHFGRGSNLGGKAIRKGFKHPEEQLEEWKKIAKRILYEDY